MVSNDGWLHNVRISSIMVSGMSTISWSTTVEHLSQRVVMISHSFWWLIILDDGWCWLLDWGAKMFIEYLIYWEWHPEPTSRQSQPAPNLRQPTYCTNQLNLSPTSWAVAVFHPSQQSQSSVAPSGFTVFKASGCSSAQEASPRGEQSAPVHQCTRAPWQPVICIMGVAGAYDAGGTGGTGDHIAMIPTPGQGVVYSNAADWWSIMIPYRRIRLGSLNTLTWNHWAS